LFHKILTRPVHGAHWGAPLRKGSQGCITNLSHSSDTFYKTFW